MTRTIPVSRWVFSAACLACLAVTGLHALDLNAGEFGGGWFTGRLVDLCFAGDGVFAVTAGLGPMRPRLAVWCTLAAICLCAPLLLYSLLPGVAQRLVPGDWSAPAPGIAEWGWQAALGLAMLAALWWPIVA